MWIFYIHYLYLQTQSFSPHMPKYTPKIPIPTSHRHTGHKYWFISTKWDEFAVFIAMIYEALTQQKTGKRNGQNIFAEIASIFSLIRCNLIAFNQFTTCRKGGGGGVGVYAPVCCGFKPHSATLVSFVPVSGRSVKYHCPKPSQCFVPHLLFLKKRCNISH